MSYSWLPNEGDKKLSNPARAFFAKPVIQGDNIEMPGIYSQTTDPISNYVEFLLENGREVNNLGELLAPLNVKYVILVNESDYQSYAYFYQQEDLTVALSKPGITVFRNEYPTARIYGVDNIIKIKSLNDYLQLSQTQNVMGNLYIIDGSFPVESGTASSAVVNTVSYEKKSPVRYQIGETKEKYVVFTLPQNISTEYWSYNGEKSLKNLGFMPAFVSSPKGGVVIYARFYHVYLPAYILSLLTIAFMIWLVVKPYYVA